MQFILLIFKDKKRTFIFIVLLGLLTGGVHVGLFIDINKIIAEFIKTGKAEPQYFIVALLLLLTYLTLNKFLSKKMIHLSQRVVHDSRMSLMNAIIKLPYKEMIVKKEMLSSTITKDTVALSQAALSSIYLITSVVTVTGCLIYLGFLSLKITGIIIAVFLSGIGIYLPNSKKNELTLKYARESEDTLFHHVREVIDGFREIKINPKKGNDIITGPLCISSIDHYDYSAKGLSGYFNEGLIGQFLFYTSLLALLFFGISFLKMTPSVLMNCIIIILYLAGPIELIIVLLPSLGTGNIAATRMKEFLLLGDKDNSVPLPVSDFTFEKLSIESVIFEYASGEDEAKSKFLLGPIDLTLNKGDLIFIYGGNGSGKTTFFHIILGLLSADQGSIFLNGKEITENETINSLFAPVFADFHLFDKLYGLANINGEKVNYYLELFELAEKVKFENDKFSLLKLSTGQRKRLALIAALLENRPLLFLDEWAADQDPFFREKFYEIILPSLKKEGFTILAITHDDRYYHTADALYKMEFGKLAEIKKYV